MKLSYNSYIQFALRADVLARELMLNPQQAAELLARISGYEAHSTMQLGQPVEGLPLSRDELISRLMIMRPDICRQRASQVVDKMKLFKDEGS
jgi:hypothetical protein